MLSDVLLSLLLRDCCSLFFFTIFHPVCDMLQVLHNYNLSSCHLWRLQAITLHFWVPWQKKKKLIWGFGMLEQMQTDAEAVVHHIMLLIPQCQNAV